MVALTSYVTVSWFLIVKTARQIRLFITARRVIIVGTSMIPTLFPGECVLFDPHAYTSDKPKLGDTVLVENPSSQPKIIIKVVAGIPGNNIRITMGGVFINNTLSTIIDPHISTRKDSTSEWSLKAEEYFLLGKNLDSSTDSRQLGPFSENSIKARAWIVLWPIGQWRAIKGQSH